MERLTAQWGINPAVPTKFDLEEIANTSQNVWNEITKLFNKLAEYENIGLTPQEIKLRLEKSVELPCKVGDMVYCIYKGKVICEKVNYFYIEQNNISFVNDGEDADYTFDITAFITKAEAEKALKES